MPYTKKIKNLEGGKKEKEKPWRDLKDRNQHQGAGSMGQTEIPLVPLGAQSPGVSRADRGKHGICQIDPARVGPEMRDTGEIPSQDSARPTFESESKARTPK